MGSDFDNPFGQKNPKGKPKSMSALLDASVFPGIQGGPLEHVIAAKAIAFQEALSEEYVTYVRQVQANAKRLAALLMERGYEVISKGTDNHLLVLNLTNKGIHGKKAEQLLDQAGITVNKNSIPFDTQPPTITSGIRLGTPAVTTRGLQLPDMERIANWIDMVLSYPEDVATIHIIKKEVEEYMQQFPLPYEN
jgi:glycine hydroxymethyltransferase